MFTYEIDGYFHHSDYRVKIPSYLDIFLIIPATGSNYVCLATLKYSAVVGDLSLFKQRLLGAQKLNNCLLIGKENKREGFSRGVVSCRKICDACLLFASFVNAHSSTNFSGQFFNSFLR